MITWMEIPSFQLLETVFEALNPLNARSTSESCIGLQYVTCLNSWRFFPCIPCGKILQFQNLYLKSKEIYIIFDLNNLWKSPWKCIFKRRKHFDLCKTFKCTRGKMSMNFAFDIDYLHICVVILKRSLRQIIFCHFVILIFFLKTFLKYYFE